MIAPPPTDGPRVRTVDAGRVMLAGRAWSGHAPIARVEVGLGESWRDATLGAELGRFAWRAWSLPWDATPGSYVLRCRATDEAGNVQPLDEPWNLQGMGNNLVQNVAVVVR